MKRLVKAALLAVGTALATSAAPAMPAAAATSGTETLSGIIVFVAGPGTNSRTVVSSVVRASGVFRGVGRVVERVLPDAAGVSRDDLVFRSGTMHVVSTPGALLSSSVNPHSCLFTGTQQFTWAVTGGTGQFDDATGSFTGTVSAVALLARNPDGSCNSRATRWTSSRRAGRCRSETSVAARGLALGTGDPAGRWRAGVSHSFLTD
jgi:hypothetical protein